jgi:PKD repeat protein
MAMCETENQACSAESDDMWQDCGAECQFAYDECQDEGGGDTSTDPNPTHTYASAGTYFVSLTANDGELFDTMSDSVTIFVDVDDAPEVGDIPDQSVTSDDSFDTFDLDNYLTELDGDNIAWSYEILGEEEPEVGFSAIITATGQASGWKPKVRS